MKGLVEKGDYMSLWSKGDINLLTQSFKHTRPKIFTQQAIIYLVLTTLMCTRVSIIECI